MMASGKTTVGKIVAERLGWAYLDSDEQVCARTGRSVRQIFEEDGEAAFRAEERQALEAAVADTQPRVISVAAGAVLDVANRDLLRLSGTVAWLRADPQLLADRVEALRAELADAEQAESDAQRSARSARKRVSVLEADVRSAREAYEAL